MSVFLPRPPSLCLSFSFFSPISAPPPPDSSVSVAAAWGLAPATIPDSAWSDPKPVPAQESRFAPAKQEVLLFAFPLLFATVLSFCVN